MTPRIKWAICLLGLAGLLLLWLRGEARSDGTASAAIVMAIDYSGSISPAEMAWQINGLIEVFADPAIERQLEANDRGWVAVTVMRFAGRPEVPPVIPWTVLRAGDGSIEGFRLQLMALAAQGGQGFSTRGTGGSNAIGRSTDQSLALEAALQLLSAAPPADRLIIDLQTDGYNREGLSASSTEALQMFRAQALAANVILNVLIVGDRNYGPDDGPSLTDYYWRYGATGMVWDARSYDQYLKALTTKVLGEMS